MLHIFCLDAKVYKYTKLQKQRFRVNFKNKPKDTVFDIKILISKHHFPYVKTEISISTLYLVQVAVRLAL